MGAAESKTLSMRGHSKHENREIPLASQTKAWRITRDENGQRTSRTVQLTRSLMGSQMSCYYQ